MSTWIAIEAEEPPKDRVIEVTSGMAWYSKDWYSKHENKTYRTWKTRGGVALAIWMPANDILKDGGFIDPTSNGILPEFKFWREYDNPLQAGELLTSIFPPKGTLSEKFEGNACKLQLLREATKEDERATTWESRHDYSDTISIQRAAKISRDKAMKLRAEAEKTYDPNE